MTIIRLASALLTILAASSTVIAQDNTEFSDFFVGTCILNEGRFEPVEAFANVSGWIPTPDNLLPMIKPTAEPSRFASWTIFETKNPLLVAVSIGDFEGAAIPTCAVMGETSYDSVVTAVLAFDATLLDETDEMVQVMRTYSIRRNGNLMLVNLVMEPRASKGMITASVTDLPDDALN